MATSSYEIPRYGLAAAQIHGWLLEAVQEGDAWLRAQRPAQNWEGIIDLLSATQGDPGGDVGSSNVGYNKAKRIAREIVASLANFRHEGEITPRWDQSLYDKGHILTELDQNWYESTNANRAHRSALQNGVALGTSYLYEVWDPHFYGPHRGDVRLTALAPNDVTFIQLPKDHDLQRAYGVIIREELPINLAKAIYERTNAGFAAGLVPDRESPGWLAKGLQKVQQFLSPALRVAGQNRQQQGSFPTVDIFHLYTMDRSIHLLPTPVTMGAHGTNWSYVVPAIGDPIPQVNLPRNPATGEYYTLPATEADCRLFPLRRYTIFSRTGICYDGSSPWWHGAVPLARLRFNDWAWEALGGSLIGETESIQDGIVALMRAIEDSAAARLDPPAVYDDSMVSSSWASAFNPRKAGVRASANLQMGDPIKFPVDPRFYDVPQWIAGQGGWIQQQEERMDYLAGVKDLVAIAKAKQIPGADTLEKLMEMAGPIVQDMVRALEEPLVQLGDWRIAYYFQFYTRPRVITLTGLDGNEDTTDYTTPLLQPWQPTEAQRDRMRAGQVSSRDVQFRPEQLTPITPGATPDQLREAAKRSIEEFRYRVTESGINEIHRMSTKLFYLQLYKLGFPLSPWTFARVSQIPNFGPPPEGTNTEMERWVAWQRMRAEFVQEMQQELGMGQPGDLTTEQSSGPGRPNSFSKPPRLQTKDSGTRTTVTTS